jgi:hypothetical protein
LNSPLVDYRFLLQLNIHILYWFLCFMILLQPNFEASTGQLQIFTSAEYSMRRTAVTKYELSSLVYLHLLSCGYCISSLFLPLGLSFSKFCLCTFLTPNALKKLIWEAESVSECGPTHPTCSCFSYLNLYSFYIFMPVKGIVIGLIYTYVNPSTLLIYDNCSKAEYTSYID